jgi:hypothetical protein
LPPHTEQLLGTGYRTDGRAIRVTNVQPGTNTMPSNVAVSAKEERNGTTANWSVTAFAICATPMTRRKVVVVTETGAASTDIDDRQRLAGVDPLPRDDRRIPGPYGGERRR